MDANSYIVAAIWLFMALFLVTGFALMYWQWKLIRYLKIARYERWEEITSFFGLPGGTNSYRVLKYIFDEREKEDEIIFRSKQKMRFWIKIFCIWLSLLGLISLIVSLQPEIK